jgi:hypothetical protein
MSSGVPGLDPGTFTGLPVPLATILFEPPGMSPPFWGYSGLLADGLADQPACCGV